MEIEFIGRFNGTEFHRVKETIPEGKIIEVEVNQDERFPIDL